MEYTLTFETEEMELQELLDSGDIAVGAPMTLMPCLGCGAHCHRDRGSLLTPQAPCARGTPPPMQ